jgi:DNA-binding NarL/FixJ family response regulator
MTAQLLADGLRKFQRLEVVGLAARSADVLKATSVRPHVAVISDNLDDEPSKGLAVAGQLCDLLPETKAILLLNSSKPDLVVAAFRAGAKGVFCRSEPLKLLYKCIQRVSAGQIWANSSEMGFVLEALQMAPSLRFVGQSGNCLLSKREQAVVGSVAEGLTNRAIAGQLGLSEHTVKNYLFRIFDKLGVSSRIEVVLYAFSASSTAITRGLTSKPNAAAAGPALPAAAPDYPNVVEQSVTGALELGQKYLDGRDVVKDKVAAYMWFLLAEKVLERNKSAKAQLASTMQYPQRAEAERRALEWLKLHRGGAKASENCLRP